MAETLWTGVAQAYARSFAGLCAGAAPALLDGLPARSRLLDVGCGTGDLVARARAVGHDATGVEPDPEMAQLARERIGDVEVAGLPDLPHADSGFEVVTAGFVLNHVDDPRAGAREITRVAAPGGVVRATIWGSAPPPQAVLWGELLDAAGAVRPPVPRLTADKDYDRSPEGLAGLMAGAGLAVVHAGTTAWQWRVRPDDLWAGLTAVGNFGVAWRAQDDGVRARLRASYEEVVAGRDHLAFDVAAVLVEARVPRSG